MRKLLIFFLAIGLVAGFSGKVIGQAVTDNDNQVLHMEIPELALINAEDAEMILTTAIPGAKVSCEPVTAYTQISSIVASILVHFSLCAVRCGNSLRISWIVSADTSHSVHSNCFAIS